MTNYEPKLVSGRVLELSLTGYFMPAHGDCVPVLIGMGGVDDLFVVVFSTVEKLHHFMEATNNTFERVQRIMDGMEFVQEIQEENTRGNRPYELRIAADPYKHENGNWRYTEIFGVGN